MVSRTAQLQETGVMQLQCRRIRNAFMGAEKWISTHLSEWPETFSIDLRDNVYVLQVSVELLPSALAKEIIERRQRERNAICNPPNSPSQLVGNPVL